MAVTINASTSAGLVQTADTTGNLNLQSNGTTIAALTSAGLAVTGAGTFSTTLGVTGVATLGNGAVLGTPASGTVTNLTGTASININGTVGATTPTTGAFTSGTFSTTLGVTGDGTVGGRFGVGAAASATYPLNLVQNDNNFIRLLAGSSRVWRIGATGANATAGTFSLIDDSAGLTRLSVDYLGAVTIPGTLGVTGQTTTGELSVIKNATTQIFYVDNINASPYIAQWRMTGTAPNNTTNSFLSCLDNTTTCFTIWSNGTTSGRSDSKLKKNIAPVNNQLEDVMAMEVVNYEWNKSIGGTKEVGFIAQQVQGVKPGLVCADEKGFLHIKQTPLTPILWKAVQELAAKVAALEAK